MILSQNNLKLSITTPMNYNMKTNINKSKSEKSQNTNDNKINLISFNSDNSKGESYIACLVKQKQDMEDVLAKSKEEQRQHIRELEDQISKVCDDIKKLNTYTESEIENTLKKYGIDNTKTNIETSNITDNTNVPFEGNNTNQTTITSFQDSNSKKIDDVSVKDYNTYKTNTISSQDDILPEASAVSSQNSNSAEIVNISSQNGSIMQPPGNISQASGEESAYNLLMKQRDKLKAELEAYEKTSQDKIDKIKKDIERLSNEISKYANTQQSSRGKVPHLLVKQIEQSSDSNVQQLTDSKTPQSADSKAEQTSSSIAKQSQNKTSDSKVKKLNTYA